MTTCFSFWAFAAPLVQRSSGEFFQDLWALWEARGKRQGFFVEFGAASGKEKSNTYFLEQGMDWKGIVAEPNPNFVALTRHGYRRKWLEISFDDWYVRA